MHYFFSVCVLISGSITFAKDANFHIADVYYVSKLGNDTNSCISPSSPCRTIQHAIDIAGGGLTSPKTIRVAAGTYHEHVVMESWEAIDGGWNVLFTEQWDFENDGLEPDADHETIVDGQNLGTCITQVKTDGAHINGLTIQNGRGTAGGIYLEHSSPNVTNCTIKNNVAYVDEDITGAGGMVNNYASPSVINCAFVDSELDIISEEWAAGAIINNHSSAQFTNCYFSNSGFIGGGPYLRGSAMVNLYSTTTLSRCQFEENIGANYTHGPLVNSQSTVVIASSSFLGNIVAESYGAAMDNFGSTVLIYNSEFIGNQIHDESLGVVINNVFSDCTIINTTFADNRNISNVISLDIGVVSNKDNSNGVIMNSILWDNFSILAGNLGYNIFNSVYIDGTSTCDVSHTDIDQDGYEGTNGNIRQDPIFMHTVWEDPGTPSDPTDDEWVGNPDYRLQSTSPCINAGANALLPSDTTDLDGDGNTTEPIPIDIAGKDRIIGGTVDMGAHESCFLNCLLSRSSYGD